MRRTLALFSLLLLILGGCGTINSVTGGLADTLGLGGDGTTTVAGGDVTSQVQRAGMTVADEPLAARQGAKVLQEGGSAADAVTTMFFTLVATYPVGAGLGGGGICLVRDPGQPQVTEYDFLPRAPAGGGSFAVPAAVRGFYDLQSDFGALPWQRMVAPGEAYAATGFPISAALLARVNAAVDVVRLDASLAAEFLDESGKPKPLGAVVTNPDLAQTMSRVRLAGPDGFFKGVTASQIVTYSTAQGGAITLAGLADVRATKGRAASHRLGSLTAWMPGPGTGAGAFTSAMLNDLAQVQTGGQADAAAVTRAAGKSLAQFGVTNLPRDMGSTGFAAVDAKGQAAACAVTLNGPFGSGRTAQGTGVTLAASPSSGQVGLASAFLTPAIAVEDGDVVLAGAGSGGPNGTAAMAYALLQAAKGQLLSHDSVRSTGATPFDTVNVISCAEGVCVAIPDPGAHGQGAAPDLAAPR